MTATKRATLQEVDLVQRFTHGYRSKLADMIGTLNRSLANGQVDSRQQESLRCCIEAVDMVLSSHEQFAKLLGTLASKTGNELWGGRIEELENTDALI